mgnify:CR=1 FL=1
MVRYIKSCKNAITGKFEADQIISKAEGDSSSEIMSQASVQCSSKQILKGKNKKPSKLVNGNKKKEGKPKKTNKKQVQEEFEVECIRDHKLDFEEKRIEFQVKWKNYGEQDNTWEDFYFFSQD